MSGTVILPMTNEGATLTFEDPEHPLPPGQLSVADFAPVSPQYFATLQVPLLEGRDFTERDGTNPPQVMIVNRAFAEKHFPARSVPGNTSQQTRD